jgi:hypothetical protein
MRNDPESHFISQFKNKMTKILKCKNKNKNCLVSGIFKAYAVGLGINLTKLTIQISSFVALITNHLISTDQTNFVF